MTMDESRRGFLKITGCTLLRAGVGIGVGSANAESIKTEGLKESLKAK